MSEWKPIETCHRHHAVLICGGTYGCEYLPSEFYGVDFSGVEIAEWDDDDCNYQNGEFHYYPKYWMELPEPPK